MRRKVQTNQQRIDAIEDTLIKRERREFNISKMTSIDGSWSVCEVLKQWTQSHWKCYLPYLHCLTPQNMFNILQTFHWQVIIFWSKSVGQQWCFHISLDSTSQIDIDKTLGLILLLNGVLFISFGCVLIVFCPLDKLLHNLYQGIMQSCENFNTQ